jgi:hypothetical protein
MAESGEPTLRAYRRLLDLREIDDPSIAFATIRFTLEGARLADQFARDDVLNELREHYQAAWDHIEERFIGARYIGPSGLPVRVLEVKRMRLLEGNGAEMMAVVQHGVDLSDLQATTIAGSDEFDRIGGKSATDPHEQVCAERQHEFETDILRDAPNAALCEKCEFSRETIQQWFSQEVPTICDNCEDLVYERPIDMEVPRQGRLLCIACRD